MKSFLIFFGVILIAAVIFAVFAVRCQQFKDNFKGVCFLLLSIITLMTTGYLAPFVFDNLLQLTSIFFLISLSTTILTIIKTFRQFK